jgi:hypothetical protein
MVGLSGDRTVPAQLALRQAMQRVVTSWQTIGSRCRADSFPSRVDPWCQSTPVEFAASSRPATHCRSVKKDREKLTSAASASANVRFHAPFPTSLDRDPLRYGNRHEKEPMVSPHCFRSCGADICRADSFRHLSAIQLLGRRHACRRVRSRGSSRAFCIPSSGTPTTFLDAPAWTFADSAVLTIIDAFVSAIASSSLISV